MANIVGAWGQLMWTQQAGLLRANGMRARLHVARVRHVVAAWWQVSSPRACFCMFRLYIAICVNAYQLRIASASAVATTEMESHAL